MRRYKIKQVDVFTTTPLCGNPVAVVLNGDGLTVGEMQAIAREMNLSETTFVLPPNRPDADYLLRIFTPRSELPFAGHPTIGSAHAIVQEGHIFNGEVPPLIRQECGIGVVPISVQKSPEGLFFIMTQGDPQWTATALRRRQGAAMLGCDESDLMDLPLEIVSTGVRWLIVPLRSLQAIINLQPNMPLIEQVCKDIGALGLTTFCLEDKQAECALRARTFAPAAGVYEDPVCGSGQGSVAAYIAKHGLMPGPKIDYLAAQGVEIQRPGTVTVRAEQRGNGKWTVQVGGQAVTVLEGEIRLK